MQRLNLFRNGYRFGKLSPFVCVIFAWSLMLPTPLATAAPSPKMPVIPKWGRFEQELHSSVTYSNALQDATLTVTFTSPLNENSEVSGFWDGGKTWRVRFSPDQPGHWTFRTTCSDTSNHGLNQQTGEFLCSAIAGTNLFYEHGPIRVARDHHHFEHADGLPFFWLADTTWKGARVAEAKDWDLYANVRLSQNFSVIQWAVAPGADSKDQAAITGFPDRIGVDPGFFKRLEAKLERLRVAGVLNAIAPVADLAALRESGGDITDEQAALFVRYVVARWGGDPVVWLLAFDNDANGKKASRWKAIGRKIFANAPHALVIVYTDDAKALDTFRDESWVDAFSCQTVGDVSDDALKAMFTGPLAKEWNRLPARPLIPFTPCENGVAPQSQKRFSPDMVRHAAYSGLFMTVPAGLSYSGFGVVNWDTTTGAKDDKSFGASLPFWQKAMFMPAAKQMGQLATFTEALKYWRLHPAPKLVSTQPGEQAPQRYVVSAATDSKDFALVYVPEDRTIELSIDELPPSPTVTWFNPRAGDTSPAVAVVGDRACKFPTPDPGDWVLVLRGGR